MLDFKTPQNTRIAPSPTGNAHIGLVRTAYLNYLAARSTGGKFILRIDDTDKVRSKQEFTDNILSTFEWLGLDYDEIYHQSKRYDRYKTLAEELIGGGWARRSDDGAVFLQVPVEELAHSWTDLIAGDIAITENDHEAVNNLVILRGDGSPTYHWASCIDDMDMGVNLVLRGTDHITNTAKHVHINKALGLTRHYTPQYGHIGLIFFQGKKISKRDGISSMAFYRENYRPESVLNAVMKLGWSHPNPKADKIMPLIDKQTAITVFPDGHLKAAKSTLDIEKLNWLDKKYGNRQAISATV